MSKNTENNNNPDHTGKILISEKDYQDRFVGCTVPAFPKAAGALMLSAFGVPLLLWIARDIVPISAEVRMMTGLLPGIPFGYHVAKTTRVKCEKRVCDTYYYNKKK